MVRAQCPDATIANIHGSGSGGCWCQYGFDDLVLDSSGYMSCVVPFDCVDNCDACLGGGSAHCTTCAGGSELFKCDEEDLVGSCTEDLLVCAYSYYFSYSYYESDNDDLDDLDLADDELRPTHVPTLSRAPVWSTCPEISVGDTKYQPNSHGTYVLLNGECEGKASYSCSNCDSPQYMWYHNSSGVDLWAIGPGGCGSPGRPGDDVVLDAPYDDEHDDPSDGKLWYEWTGSTWTYDDEQKAKVKCTGGTSMPSKAPTEFLPTPKPSPQPMVVRIPSPTPLPQKVPVGSAAELIDAAKGDNIVELIDDIELGEDDIVKIEADDDAFGHFTSSKGKRFRISKATAGAIFETERPLTLQNMVLDHTGAEGPCVHASSTVTARDVTFIGSSTEHGGHERRLAAAQSVPNGGAVSVSSGDVVLENCEFFNCSASGDGGAVYFKNDKGSVQVLDSVFKGCASGGSGGAVYADAFSVTIAGTAFDDSDDGAALYMKGTSDAVVRESRFTRNGKAGNSSSTIYLRRFDNVDLETIVLEENEGKGDGGDGGLVDLVRLTDLRVVNSTFVNNPSRVFRSDKNRDGTFKFSGCEFADNIHSVDPSGDDEAQGGAAILIKESSMSDVHISDCTFVGNEVRVRSDEYEEGCYGGALHVSGSVLIENCVFERNRAYEGGGLYTTSAYLKIAKTEFRANKAQHGGSIAGAATSDSPMSGTIELSSVYGVGNTALDRNNLKSGGGFMNVYGGTVTARELVLYRNTAREGKEASGLIFESSTVNLWSITTDTDVMLSNGADVSVYCSSVGFADAEDNDNYRGNTIRNNSAECSLCHPGFEWHGAPSYDCKACESPLYKGLGNATCALCPAGLVKNDDATACGEPREYHFAFQLVSTFNDESSSQA